MVCGLPILSFALFLSQVISLQTAIINRDLMMNEVSNQQLFDRDPLLQKLNPQLREVMVASSPETLSTLKEMILSQIADELGQLRNGSEEEIPETANRVSLSQETVMKKKRKPFYFSMNPEEFASAKRQIRYHQCYFNPISCFKRK